MEDTKQPDCSTNSTEIATLGGGCFWCLQPIFEDLHGVVRVEVGYSGGMLDLPTYKQVCTGRTGHAEVVQVTFSPVVISYKEILQVFFAVHNPTTRDKQGADVGTQYRSVIFHHSNAQKLSAEQVIRELEKENAWGAPVVTEVVPFKKFYRAEDYHQSYFANNPGDGYCQLAIAPKVAKFRKTYASKLKPAMQER